MKKFIGVLLLACALSSAAFAQTPVKCKFITDAAVPITAPGFYCLRANVVGRGIVIDASDVVLDLKGYSIINDGTATEPLEFGGGVVGVLSENDNNITVRNGIIRGFDFGLRLGYPAGVKGTLLVEKLYIYGSRQRGIDVLGYETINILDNVVSGTKGGEAIGIYARGRTDPYNNHVNLSVLNILRNRVHDTRVSPPPGQSFRWSAGIAAWDGSSMIVENNVITEVYSDVPSWRASGIEMFNRFPYTARANFNTIINSRVDSNTYGLFLNQAMGTPEYTGEIGYFGQVNGSRIQNFANGVTSTSALNVNGAPVAVTCYSYSNNVVSGATVRAYYGGFLGSRSNRTE